MFNTGTHQSRALAILFQYDVKGRPPYVSKMLSRRKHAWNESDTHQNLTIIAASNVATDWIIQNEMMPVLAFRINSIFVTTICWHVFQSIYGSLSYGPICSIMFPPPHIPVHPCAVTDRLSAATCSYTMTASWSYCNPTETENWKIELMEVKDLKCPLCNFDWRWT